MFLRELSGTTLTDLRDALDTKTETVRVPTSNIVVDVISDEPKIAFPIKGRSGDTTYEVPADKHSVSVLAGYLQIPDAFQKRLPSELRQLLLAGLISRASGEALIVYSEHGIEEMRDPGQQVYDHRRIVDVAMRVIDPTAEVVEWWRDANEFRFDTIVPEGFDRGVTIGKRPTARQVGDITRSGLRFGHDVKHNLTPWTQPYHMRLVCTNGMETFDNGLKVDARGLSVDEVMEELEEAAQRAFSRVEAEAKAFYDLREEAVKNAERLLRTLAREQELPDRTLIKLLDRAQTDALPDEPTRFDVVNLITNQANDPTIRNKTGARRSLEQVGGVVVVEHAERCGHCQSRIVKD